MVFYEDERDKGGDRLIEETPKMRVQKSSNPRREAAQSNSEPWKPVDVVVLKDQAMQTVGSRGLAKADII